MGLFRNWLKKKPSVRQNSREASQPPAPNFFIVGAARSGTTSLWQYLRQHPDIFMPGDIAWKEPSYYCDTYGVESYAAYLSSVFKDATTEKRIGEASTPYLTSPESARKIHDGVPDPRIIMLLRNPVDRAYSLWKWMHAYGYETIGSFEEALEAEFSSRKDKPEFMSKFRKGYSAYYWDFLYFHSGLYFDQVKRYRDLFSRKQLAIIIFEEFVEKPLKFVHRLYEFLGVDPGFEPDIKIHNAVPGYSPMNVNTQLDLQQRYLHDVTRLSKLLKRDLNSFWFH
jgi:hypothetical protein